MIFPTLPMLYHATWLWLPVLILFLVQGLRCVPSMKLLLFKMSLYYIVCAIGLQLLLPESHLGLRTMLFDLTTRVFLFVQASEILGHTWAGSPQPAVGGVHTLKQHTLMDEDESEQPVRRGGITMQQKMRLGYAVTALLYLGWMVLGVLFAFTLTPGM